MAQASPPLSQKSLHVERLLSFKHVEDCTSHLVCQNTECFACVMFALESFVFVFDLLTVPDEENCRFGKGPLEMRIADLLATARQTFASRFLGWFDKPGVGSEALHPWESGDIVDFVEEYQ